jgi:GDP-L-fucose synthase
MKSRILLTGGSGMVGRNFLESYSKGELDVLAPRSNELNLLDFSAVEAYLRDHNPDIIIHAAGRVGGIQANIREPVGFLMENLDMGRNIVWAARTCGVKRLLNLGSSCMYPRNAANPLREDMVLKGELEPTNEGYALAKVVTARLCEYISREDSSYNYKTLIPCNIFGRYDKFDPSYSHLLPAIIHKIYQAKLSGLTDVEVWGDGTARREFMYAGDFADCIIESIRRFDSLPHIMNVGVGVDTSINEYYKIVAEVIGYSGKFNHDLNKPVGMVQKLVSTNKLKEWGWHAKVSLSDGIEKTFAYYLQLRNGKS